MAAHTRKRCKPPGSTNSSSPSISSRSQNPPPQEQQARKTLVVDDSDEDPPATNCSKSQGMTDEEELKRALRVHSNQLSSCYASYNPPQLLNQLDKSNRRMISYSCKMCGSTIHRPIHDTSPSNLLKHVATCLRKQQDGKKNEQNLAAVGVLGTGNINLREVPQLCAIWCAEAARPFSALTETLHQALLHPEVVKNLPTRKTVSCDIGRLYTAVHESFIEKLEKHKGALYLGLDCWQSPNGFKILGTVVYCLVEDAAGRYDLEAMPLDFVLLKESHTGIYLADTVRLIVEKLWLQNKICGFVTDNASNNQKMIDEIQKFKLPQIKGEGQWIRCFAHMMNLIVQVVLRPFGSYKKNKKNNYLSINDVSDKDEDNEADEQIKRFNIDEYNEEDDDEPGNDNDISVDDSMLACNLINDEDIELEESDAIEMSDEEEAIMEWQKDRRHGPP